MLYTFKVRYCITMQSLKGILTCSSIILSHLHQMKDVKRAQNSESFVKLCLWRKKKFLCYEDMLLLLPNTHRWVWWGHHGIEPES